MTENEMATPNPQHDADPQIDAPTQDAAPQDSAPEAAVETPADTQVETDDASAEEPSDEGAEGETAAPAKSRHVPSRQQLEEEGDIAADYLEELLDIVDLDGDIDIDVENGRAAVSIVGDGIATRSLRQLVGPQGEVLEALQELTRLAVQAKTGERSRLMLDVAAFRAHRKEELERVATDAIEKVKADGTPVKLDPMSPFERKVVHDVATAAGFSSESEGEGSDRRVVISV